MVHCVYKCCLKVRDRVHSDTCTDQGSEDEEDHEDTPKRRLTVEITVANSWHGDQCEIDTFPVGHGVSVGEVLKRVTRVFHLTTTHNTTLTNDRFVRC